MHAADSLKLPPVCKKHKYVLPMTRAAPSPSCMQDRAEQLLENTARAFSEAQGPAGPLN